MYSYFLAQFQAPPIEDLFGEIFQDVLSSILLIFLIAGALLLAVILLRFAAKVNALPQTARTSASKSPSSSDPSKDASSLGNPSKTIAHIDIAAQNYQSVSVQWTIPVELTHSLQRVHGNSLMIRLLDVTQIDLAHQLPHAIYDYPYDWVDDDTPQVMGIAVVQGDRDYIAELGYMTADRQWIQLARSSNVRVAAAASSS